LSFVGILVIPTQISSMAQTLITYAFMKALSCKSLIFKTCIGLSGLPGYIPKFTQVSTSRTKFSTARLLLRREGSGLLMAKSICQCDDIDMITIETSCSQMELLDAFEDESFIPMRLGRVCTIFTRSKCLMLQKEINNFSMRYSPSNKKKAPWLQVPWGFLG
jgi:hypothetical protein